MQPNESPFASFSFSPQTPEVGERVTFTANADDSDGTVQSYDWDLTGNGSTDASGSTVTFTYDEQGSFAVTLTVTDDDGATATDNRTIMVDLPPNESPSVSFSFSPTNPRAGDTVNFTANASDPDGEIVNYEWDFNNDGTRDATGANPTFAYEEQGEFTASLTVTDDRDATNSATESVSVRQRFTTVEITAVEIQDMPFTNSSGQGWDFTSGPDVFFAFYDDSDQFIRSSSTIDNVGSSDLPISPGTSGIVIDDLTERRIIRLFDEDATTDADFISGIEFVIEDLGLIGTYPSTTTLSVDDTTLELSLEWSE